MPKTYNLADEPWICLIGKDGTNLKENLRNVFLNTARYRDLGGETRLQDAAVLRLLTAVSVTLLYRYDENGRKAPLAGRQQALERFAAVWKAGGFNKKAVDDYFDTWHDRFDLLDPDRPFYQVPSACLSARTVQSGKKKQDDEEEKQLFLPDGIYMNYLPASFFNGRILRSANRPNVPYKDLADEASDRLPLDAAARWLVFYNAYADCSVGKGQRLGDGKDARSANAAMPLPARGLTLTAVGKNLFETIMLGSVLFSPDRGELYPTVRPVWEEEEPDIAVKPERNFPNDLARMYTQQARRMLLVVEDDMAVGMYAAAGETYADSQMWMEPSFIICKTTKDGIPVPKKIEQRPGLWKEIEHIAGDKGAGITRWVNTLYGYRDGELFDERIIPFRAAGVLYGQSCCGYTYMGEDSISMHRDFLTDSELLDDAVAELQRIFRIEKAVFKFGLNCSACMGMPSNDKNIAEELSSRYLTDIGYVYQRFLTTGIPVETLRALETRTASDSVENVIRRNLAAMLRGRNDMTLGKAESIFAADMAAFNQKG